MLFWGIFRINAIRYSGIYHSLVKKGEVNVLNFIHYVLSVNYFCALHYSPIIICQRSPVVRPMVSQAAGRVLESGLSPLTVSEFMCKKIS